VLLNASPVVLQIPFLSHSLWTGVCHVCSPDTLLSLSSQSSPSFTLLHLRVVALLLIYQLLLDELIVTGEKKINKYKVRHESVWGNGCIDPRFFDLGTSLRRGISHPHRSYYPQEKSPRTHWIGGWVGLRTGLDDVEKRKFFILPGLELRPFGRPARSQSLYRQRYPGS
jgi:hypothetical protein